MGVKMEGKSLSVSFFLKKSMSKTTLSGFFFCILTPSYAQMIEFIRN